MSTLVPERESHLSPNVQNYPIRDEEAEEETEL
jgi:hypothetical protein